MTLRQWANKWARYLTGRKVGTAVVGVLGLLASDPAPLEWGTKLGIAGIVATLIWGTATEDAAIAQSGLSEPPQ